MFKSDYLRENYCGRGYTGNYIISGFERRVGCDNFKAILCRIVSGFVDYSGSSRRKIKNMEHRQLVRKDADGIVQEV